MRYGSLFTGGGGFDIGAREAGMELAWGVEYIPAIATWANSQLGGHVRCLDILATDPSDFEPVDWLHASPPCPSFSVANAKGGETDHDIALSAAVARFLAHHKPRYFSLENVYGYRNSKSWRTIRDELDRLGYGWSLEHINSADYGVPQKRRRMIVRAHRGTFFNPPPMRPTHAQGGAGGLLPWVGWWEAVADIAHTFPESKLAKWQVERLGGEVLGGTLVQRSAGFGDAPELIGLSEPVAPLRATRHDKLSAILVESKGAVAVPRPPRLMESEQPAFTVVTIGDDARVILVEGSTAGDRPPTLFAENEPGPTCETGAGGRLHRMIEGSRVVALTPRALARFQTFPDWYELPAKKTLAVTIIGNAVPCLLAQRIVESMT